jgi:colanic acid biosynthesis protein WcaH
MAPEPLPDKKFHGDRMILPTEEYRRVASAVPIICVDCLVVNEEGQFLLVKRANPPLKDEYWVPGGRVYKNERLIDAVHRKMREEIGVDVEVVVSLGIFEYFDGTPEREDPGFHTVSIVYLVKPLSYEIKIDNQSTDWGWFKDVPAKLRIGSPACNLAALAKTWVMGEPGKQSLDPLRWAHLWTQTDALP